MAKGNKFILGALIGSAAGAIAGILTAPKSGKETRADLKRKAEEIKDDAGEYADNTKQQLSKAAEDVREKADEYKSRASRAVKSAKEEFEKEAKK